VPPELPDTLTQKEAEVWKLHQQGMSTRALAALLKVSRTAIRDTLARAEQKIARAAERQLAK
jgi:DNA-binding CsgD family transcriptional regulator